MYEDLKAKAEAALKNGWFDEESLGHFLAVPETVAFITAASPTVVLVLIAKAEAYAALDASLKTHLR